MTTGHSVQKVFVEAAHRSQAIILQFFSYCLLPAIYIGLVGWSGHTGHGQPHVTRASECTQKLRTWKIALHRTHKPCSSSHTTTNRKLPWPKVSIVLSSFIRNVWSRRVGGMGVCVTWHNHAWFLQRCVDGLGRCCESMTRLHVLYQICDACVSSIMI